MLTASQRAIGRKWSQGPHGERKWYNTQVLSDYIRAAICPGPETGVPGALRAALGGDRLGRGVSIGAGAGQKEMAMLAGGLVDRFELFELSEARAEAARQAAAARGLSDRVEVRIADAFATATEARYDLVYWDHALHHMFDVDMALRWSLRSLRPGGLLVVNDYVGPTRLQWTRREIDYGRRFLEANRGLLEAAPSALRYKTPLDRLRQIYRDRSEAPQSDRIMPGFEKHCGTAMRPLGGAMIHLCTRFLPEDEADEAYARIIEWDRRALADGLWHFAFGLWKKPA